MERLPTARSMGFRQRLALRVLGLLVAAAALAPPFSGVDTLPSMGAIAVGMSILLEDVVVLVVSVVLGFLGVALIITLRAAMLELVADLV